MTEFETWVPLHAHYLWIIAGFLLALGEILTGGFVLLWFAVGAFAGGLGAWFGGSFNVQVVIFALASLSLFACSRTVFSRLFMRGRPGATTNVDAMIGRQAEVIGEIGPGIRTGTVRVGGETWAALSNGAILPPGTLVTIETIDGLKVRVRAIDGSSPPAEAKRQQQ